ncbi:MAG: Zn-ribbon domain-containing OB-fold protein [bacterium]
MNEEKKRVPVREGLWTSDGKPQLIGSQCTQCREVFFPKRENGLCSYCQSSNLKEIKLSPKGKIYSYTVVMQRPPGYYKAEVPYGIGFVELPEGIRVETLFTGCDLEDLRVEMDVELMIDKLHEEEDDTEVYCYKFRPVTN